jgi:Na+/H+-dicarboxylate symporter
MTDTTGTDVLRGGRWQAIQARLDLGNTMGWLGAYALITLITGALAGTVWYWVVDLPGYTIDANYYAHMGELGHAMVFSADAWLVALGVVAAVLGWLAWRWFGRLGWPSAIIAAVAGALAGFVTSQVGHILGPGDLDESLARALPAASDNAPVPVIPVQLTSHTPVYLAAWVALAVLPVTIAAVLAPTAKDPRGWRRLES